MAHRRTPSGVRNATSNGSSPDSNNSLRGKPNRRQRLNSTAQDLKEQKRVRSNMEAYARRRDTMTYTGFLLLAILNAYLCGADPCGYLIDLNFYTYIYLYVFRVYRFLKFRNGWYLIDFCYVGNWIVWGNLYFNRFNGASFSIAYYFGVCTLGLALLTFNNGYIFHSIDHMMTLFIHHAGLVVLTVMRWSEDPRLDAALAQSGMIQNLPNCLIAYLCWFIPYYVIIFIIFWGYIKRNNFDCLYRHTIQISPWARRFIRLSTNCRSCMFMLTHVIWCWGLGSLAILCFYSKIVNYAILFICLFSGTFNGGTYFFEYMVKHYEAGIKSKEIVNNPQNIISFDYGQLVEAIGAGRSQFTMPSQNKNKDLEDLENIKKPSAAARFSDYMAKK